MNKELRIKQLQSLAKQALQAGRYNTYLAYQQQLQSLTLGGSKP